MYKMPVAPRVKIWAGIIFAGCLLNNSFGQTDYRLFVANEKSGNLTVINGSDFQIIKTVPIGKRTGEIQPSPDGKTLYVALPDLATNRVGVVDLATDKVLRTIPAGPGSGQFALSRDGQHLFIANEDTSMVIATEIASGKIIDSIPVSAKPTGVCVCPDGKFFYVSCETTGDIFVIDAAHPKVIGLIKLSPGTGSIVFSTDGGKAYALSGSAAEVDVIDTGNHTLIKTISLPKACHPRCLKLAADDNRLYIGTDPDGVIYVIDAALEQVVDTIKVDRSPRGLAFSPDGKFLITANDVSDDVSVVDLARGKEVVRVKVAAGGNPADIIAVPTGK